MGRLARERRRAVGVLCINARTLMTTLVMCASLQALLRGLVVNLSKLQFSHGVKKVSKVEIFLRRDFVRFFSCEQSPPPTLRSALPPLPRRRVENSKHHQRSPTRSRGWRGGRLPRGCVTTRAVLSPSSQSSLPPPRLTQLPDINARGRHGNWSSPSR